VARELSRGMSMSDASPICCVNATYVGTRPFGKTFSPSLTETGVSSPRGLRCRLKLIFVPP
jgi:hypothetical protein